MEIHQVKRAFLEREKRIIGNVKIKYQKVIEDKIITNESILSQEIS